MVPTGVVTPPPVPRGPAEVPAEAVTSIPVPVSFVDVSHDVELAFHVHPGLLRPRVRLARPSWLLSTIKEEIVSEGAVRAGHGQ